MICTLSELREKEVINIKNGEKLGFIDDIKFEPDSEKIASFVIFGRKRLYGLLGRDSDLVIACQQIKLIGIDTVLVSFSEENCAKGINTKRFRFRSLL